MHRLPADLEGVGDGLPAPALLSGVGDVDRLEPFLEALQCPHGAQANSGVGTAKGLTQEIEIRHVVKIT
jgi:hypothetical protein